jgi:hypothetical protein
MRQTKKKSGRKALIRKLDKIFSKYIRARDKKCVVCGSIEHLQCGHLLSRVNYSTRWDEINANCQCGHCNIVHNTNPGPYMLWFIETHGKKELHKLTKQYGESIKYKNIDIEIMIEEYTKKYAELEDERFI